MELFDGIHSLSDAALLAGLSATRIAVAFLLLPVFSPDTVPALVRNAIFMALGMLALALQPAVSPAGWTAAQWLGLFTKEAMLGLALGFGLASFLWAFAAAGQIVDTKVGMANAQVTDPMSGQQTTLSAALLGRLAGLMFMFGGGFLLFVGTLVESFSLWPLGQVALAPKPAGVEVFEQALSNLMSLAFLVAAPVLVVMFAVDLTLGLINRYAQQLNVSSISASIKGVASTMVWMLVLSTLVQGFGDEVQVRVREVLPQVARLMK